MPKTRTTHVFRAANRDDRDIWLDVERVDKHIGIDRLGKPRFRKMTRMMDWGDEYADPYEHPTRTIREVEIKNPEDEAVLVPLPVIDQMVTRQGQGQLFLKATKIYANDRETNQTRVYSVRRVFHWDTETDPRDDGGTEYVRIDGTEDRSQYVDVALLERITTRSGQGIKFKKKTYVFNTAPIKEYSEPTPEDEIDLEKIIFIDPWQNIVNVQWGSSLLIAYGWKQSGEGAGWHSEYSTRGETWVANTPPNSADPSDRLVGMAYGNGTWVAAGTDAVSGGMARIATSENGVDWEPSILLPDTETFSVVSALAFGQREDDEVGTFVLGTDGGEIFTSTDGVTWTARGVLGGGNPGTGRITAINFVNDKFYAGSAWEVDEENFGAVGWNSTGYGYFHVGEIYAYFGANPGAIVIRISSIHESTNGETWTSDLTGLATGDEIGQSYNSVNGFAYGNKKRVAAGAAWRFGDGEFLEFVNAYTGWVGSFEQTIYCLGGDNYLRRSNLIAYGDDVFIVSFAEETTSSEMTNGTAILGRSSTGEGWSSAFTLGEAGLHPAYINGLVHTDTITEPETGYGLFVAGGSQQPETTTAGLILTSQDGGTTWVDRANGFTVVQGIAVGKRGGGATYIE